MRLSELDRRYLPAATTRLRALADRLGAQRARVARWRRQLEGVRLGELDARYARSGPFALMREVPQVGFVLIAAVFLAGAGTAVTRQSARDKRAEQNVIAAPAPTPVSAEPSSSALGPDVGETTAQYLAASRTGLDQAAAGGADSRRLALVSFTDYRTPAQAQAMLAGVTIRRVYLRAKAGGKDAAQLPVDITGPLLPQLRTAYAQTAKSRLEAQKAYLGYVNSLQVTTKEDQAFKDLYASFATTTGVEARQYQRGCACVYAAVVEAKASGLLALRSRGSVRGVQVAGKGLQLRLLLVHPLLPEVTGVVPKQQAGVDNPP